MSAPLGFIPLKLECVARRTVSAARIRFLDGTQPTFTQVPPKSNPAFTISVVSPKPSALMAAENAAEPPPIIIKSN